MSKPVIEMDDQTAQQYRNMLNIPEDGKLPLTLVNEWRAFKRMWCRICGTTMTPEMLVTIARFAGERIRDPNERGGGDAPPPDAHDYFKYRWWDHVDVGTRVIVRKGGDRPGVFMGMGNEVKRTLCIRLDDESLAQRDRNIKYDLVRIFDDGTKVRAVDKDA